MSQVLFIGLDGVEPTLLTRWMASGDLPNLSRFVAKGSEVPVAVHRAVGDGAIWPSIYTATSVASHGRLFRLFVEPGTYEITKFKYKGKVARPPFWKTLSDKGKRVAVLDMVRAPFTEGINGVHVNEWLEHDGGGCECWPPEFRDTLLKHYPKDPLQGNSAKWLQRNPGDFVGLRDHLLNQIGAKTGIVKGLLKNDQFDLLTAVYGEAHDIGHSGWHLHDPNHYAYDADWVAQHGDPVKDVCVATDAALGELLETLDDDARVFIFAGIGMESNWTGNAVLEDILRKLEHRPKPRARGLYRRLVPKSIRHAIRRLSMESSVVGDIKNSSKRTDRAARKAFVVPHNDHAATIRLNIVGRDPEGKLSPGKELDDYIDWLSAELYSLVDADTGKAIVRDIVKTSQLVDGDKLDQLPDLFIIWDRDKPFRRIRSASVGEIEVASPSPRTGDHTNNATLYTDRQVTGIDAIQLQDIAPTMAAALGQPLEDVEGEAVEALV